MPPPNQTPNELLAILNALLGPSLQLLMDHDKLSPWVKDLQASQQALLAPAQTTPAPSPDPPTPLTRVEADERNEAAARCYRDLLRAQRNFARAQGDPAAAARWREVESFTLSEGLSFTQSAQRVQIAGAQRCLEATRHPDVAPDLAAPPLPVDFNAALALLASTTEGLQTVLDAAETQAADPTNAASAPPTPAALQREARRRINRVLSIARDELDPKDLATLEATLPK